MAPPAVISDLVERFARHREAYRSGHYNETQLRREFIDPFFKALGWDVDNERGYAEAYKDVIHEDAIRVGGGVKAPDYCFRIGGTRKFFVEAKKPSVDIRGGTHPAYQLRRYAWSAKLPLSILTDFEELAVYDCRVRPARTDPASKARTLYLTYDAYADRWDQIAGIFAREAVLQGSFDQYAESTRRKRGTTEVDDAFLAEIESWRDLLARNIALRNPALSQRELNFAVQRTIDRIIFLRICEDRGLEPYGRLQALLGGPRVYPRLFQFFERADERYNSGLFHFRRDTSRDEAPDALTPALAIDDKPLKAILGRLYYPDSPYEFSVLPADILGQVYEQFLGKIIRLTAGHRAVVEDKPEVKKAGGVYYTPTYIVDYIVEHTVGTLLGGPAARNAAVPAAPASEDAGVTPRKRSRGMTPRRAAKLRILDPACGSGSFLLGAYQRLLDWHLDYYTSHDPEKWARGRTPRIYQVGAAGGRQSATANRQSAIGNRQSSWRLTTAERKRILLNNIFGVDIDPQAVEVTKLSLLLRVLEGESGETLHRQWELFHERALPDLACNIKCGNSLIGPDFYRGQQLTLFDEDERLRINVFDWQAEFPAILGGKNPGFDVVIGNPPYVRPHRLTSDVKEYFWRRYTTFVRKSDLYCCFLERGVSLLRRGGALGFIVSNGWLRLDSFEAVRKFLLSETSLERIVDFTGDVFPNATVKTAIVVVTRGERRRGTVQVATTEPTQELGKLSFRAISQASFLVTYKCIIDLSLDESQEAVKSKMRAVGKPLGDCFDLSFGIKTGDDSKFLTTTPRGEAYKPLLRGADVHRYEVDFKGEYVWYVPGKMREHRSTARPGTPERFEQPKVLVRDTGEGLQCTYDGRSYYVKDVIILSQAGRDEAMLKALAGILNSRLMRFYYETSFPTLHVQRDEVASLPVPDLKNPDEQRAPLVESISRGVDRMLELHQRLRDARTSHQHTALRRHIAATDAEIDGLVYELYGLTEAEIAILEGACP